MDTFRYVDTLRCRYSDCKEQHPVAVDNEDNPNDPVNERVTCSTCREWMGLPEIDENGNEK